VCVVTLAVCVVEELIVVLVCVISTPKPCALCVVCCVLCVVCCVLCVVCGSNMSENSRALIHECSCILLI
jgi:hypothetical protein